jgi:hypothetical protein
MNFCVGSLSLPLSAVCQHVLITCVIWYVYVIFVLNLHVPLECVSHAMLQSNACHCIYLCLCGLVVRVPGYRSRGLGLIPFATRLSEKLWVCTGVHSASWVQLRILGRKSSGFGLEIREYVRRDLPLCPCGTLYPQKLALTPSTSCGRSVGIVRSQTQAT